MEVYLRGRGKINFTKDDYVASGGEAKIYKQGLTAFKIFHKQKDMIPEAKFNELQVITLPNIIKPQEIVTDKNNAPIGFTSNWVEGTPLCKIFVTGYRKRNGITDDHVVKLIGNIKDGIAHVHQNGCVIVDGNELNYLVDDDHITPYFIDVNAWKTKTFPPTAIMNSIRDFTTDEFTPSSDWFSFAVIACWTFVGVHPFKGNHPQYKHSDIEERTKQRMLDKVSIFNKDVKVAPNARMKSIPSHYEEWFKQVFENGVRCAPPSESGVIAMIPSDIHVIRGTDNFDIVKIKSFPENIIWYARISGQHVSASKDKVFVEKFAYNNNNTDAIVFSETKRIPIFASVSKSGRVNYHTPTNDTIRMSDMNVQEFMVIGNHLYCRNKGNLTEMRMSDQMKNITPVVKQVWKIMPNSSTLYAGVIYQDILGIPFLAIPVPSGHKSSRMYNVKVTELDGHKMIDAKHDNHVCALHTHKDGKYNIIIMRFNDDYTSYDFRVTEVADIGDINMITLEQGICIIIPENGVMEAFVNNPALQGVKRVHDSTITTDMRLCKDGTQAMFYKDKDLYRISLK